MEREKTDPKMANYRIWHYSVSASLLGSDLSLHSHCVDQDCSCLFPVDLMEAALSQPNAWGFENAGMSEKFFNGLERAVGQQERH